MDQLDLLISQVKFTFVKLQKVPQTFLEFSELSNTPSILPTISGNAVCESQAWLKE